MVAATAAFRCWNVYGSGSRTANAYIGSCDVTVSRSQFRSLFRVVENPRLGDVRRLDFVIRPKILCRSESPDSPPPAQIHRRLVLEPDLAIGGVLQENLVSLFDDLFVARLTDVLNIRRG